MKIRKIGFQLIILIILFSVYSNPSYATDKTLIAPKTPYIQFLGAAQMVGGSCYLIDTGKTRFLVDFGLFFGDEYRDRNEKVGFDPRTIDFVLLTHAHIDHVGRIPMLYRYGFKGKVICTDATKSIAGVMLEMSVNISRKTGTAIYDFRDYGRSMNNFESIPYDQITKLTDDVSIRLRDAGHVLGSSIIEIWIKVGQREIKIVATGDMGPGSVPILRDPAIVPEGDYYLIESTYGSTQRGPNDYREFGKDIQSTINSGGSVLIPAFVLEKTQKIIYLIGQLKREGFISKDVPVFADSSTGQELTRMYRKYTKYYNSEALSLLSNTGDPLSFPSLYEVSGKVSLRNHGQGDPAIYLTSSGMLDHANAPRHLLEMIDDPRNLLAIVGWQSPDSLGRKLQKGRKWVEIPLEDYNTGKTKYVKKRVKMKVRSYSAFSSHTDRCRTLKWLSNIQRTKEIFVVHGDKESAIDLAKTISRKLGFKAVAPEIGEKIYMTLSDESLNKKEHPSLCDGLNKSDHLESIADQ